jgi:putative ABC transport system substrate-binding protein
MPRVTSDPAGRRHHRRAKVATAKAAQAATKQIPIIFMGGSDPVGIGLVQSLARPGGNITGTADLDIDLGPKRMEIFRELVPGLKRMLLPYDATNTYVVAQLPAYRDAARRLGLTLAERPLRTEEEAQAALAKIRKGDADGIFAPRFLSLNIPGFILDTAQKQRLPTIFHGLFFAERGDWPPTRGGRTVARMPGGRPVDKISSASWISRQQPTTFELVVNLQTAKALGLSIPALMLLRANRVIGDGSPSLTSWAS